MGGVQLRIIDVANRLGAAYTHTVLALDENTEACARLQPQTRLTAKSGTQWPARLIDLPAFRRCLYCHSPDIICTYNWGSMNWAFAAASLPIPHLHFESGFSAEEATSPFLRRSLFRRLALRRAAALIVPSKTLYDLARAQGWVPDKRLRWIVNGVDTDYYRRDAVTGDRMAQPPSVAAVAPLRREKRLDRLIAAARRLDQAAEIRVCGDGPERSALESLAQENAGGARIVFLGSLTDIRPALAESAVFAITSQTEQMPNALLQAMAMELPVIAYDAGDIRRILPEPQHAFVYAQDDECGFREGLAALLEDDGLRHRLGALNRRRVTADYAMDAMVDAYRRLYEDALATRP